MKKCQKCWGTGRVLDQRRLGNEVRRLRRQRGIGQSDLAKSMGISRSLLSLLEAGQRNWSRRLWLKIKP